MRLLEKSMSERRPCSREVDPRNKRIHLNSEIRGIRQPSQFDPTPNLRGRLRCVVRSPGFGEGVRMTALMPLCVRPS